jgi:hypothetical protein
VTPYAARELKWAEIQMKLDIMESRIAAASPCHSYFIRDGIKADFLAYLRGIGESVK